MVVDRDRFVLDRVGVDHLFADRLDSHRACHLAREGSAHAIGHGHYNAIAIDRELLRLDDELAVFLIACPSLSIGYVQQEVIVLVALAYPPDMRAGMCFDSQHQSKECSFLPIFFKRQFAKFIYELKAWSRSSIMSSISSMPTD